MHEYWFRGRVRSKDRFWVEGHGVCMGKEGASLIFSGKYDNKSVVDTDTVGQFTGVTANGKKIFEGDIVKGLFLFGMEIMAVVVFKDGAFGLQWNRGEVTEFSAFTSLCNVQYEVVGNIHDNPELLGGGNHGPTQV